MIKMNKQQYMDELKKALEGKTLSHEADKIMDYYEQYFDDANDFGRSDDEVSQEFGSPQTLADEVLEGLTMMRQDLFNGQVPLRLIDCVLLDIRVHLVISSREEVYVTYQGNEKFNEEVLNVDLRGDHLFIRQKKQRLLNFNTFYQPNQVKPYLLIEVPQSYRGRLQVKTKDSRIVVDGSNLESKCKFDLQSKNARIIGEQLICHEVVMLSQRGRIDLEDSKAKTLSLTCDEGRIQLVNVEAKYLCAHNKEGRIMVNKGHYELAELVNEEAKIVVEDALIDDCRMENEEGRCSYVLNDNPCGLHLDLLSRQGKVIINGVKFNKGIPLIRDVRPQKKEKKFLNLYVRSSTGRIEIEH